MNCVPCSDCICFNWFASVDFCCVTGVCPEPGGVPFSTRTRYKGPYNVSDQVTFSCLQGGGGTITCQRNGNWTQKPLCISMLIFVQQIQFASVVSASCLSWSHFGDIPSRICFLRPPNWLITVPGATTESVAPSTTEQSSDPSTTSTPEKGIGECEGSSQTCKWEIWVNLICSPVASHICTEGHLWTWCSSQGFCLKLTAWGIDHCCSSFAACVSPQLSFCTCHQICFLCGLELDLEFHWSSWPPLLWECAASRGQ